MVENPASLALPHKKQLPSSIPNIDSLEGIGSDTTDEYSTLKKLQRHLEYASRGSRCVSVADLAQIYPIARRVHQGRAEVGLVNNHYSTADNGIGV